MTTGIENYTNVTMSYLASCGILDAMEEIGICKDHILFCLIEASSEKLADVWDVDLTKQELAAMIQSMIASELAFQHSEHVNGISVAEDGLLLNMTNELYWYISSMCRAITHDLIESVDAVY